MGNNDFDVYDGIDAEEVEEYNEDIHGITDIVTDYTFANISFPCIMFKDGFKLEKHKINVIVNMVKSVSKDKDITLYFRNNGELTKIGAINGYQLSSLIDIAGRTNLTAYLAAEEELTDSLIYTLCSF